MDLGGVEDTGHHCLHRAGAAGRGVDAERPVQQGDAVELGARGYSVQCCVQRGELGVKGSQGRLVVRPAARRLDREIPLALQDGRGLGQRTLSHLQEARPVGGVALGLTHATDL